MAICYMLILGMTLLLFLTSRFLYGLLGQKAYRFSNWFPYKVSYLATIKEDLQDLAMLKLPKRQDHQGLAGLVQAFGLVIFSWMAITGTIMFVTNVSDDSFMSELHEVGEGLIPFVFRTSFRRSCFTYDFWSQSFIKDIAHQK